MEVGLSDHRVHSSESRDRVLQAAYALFLESGYPAVSMQQIAESAGITKATLYHHFRDKQDLYLATIRLAISRDEAAMEARLAEQSDARGIANAVLSYILGPDRADLQRLGTEFKQHMNREIQREFWRQFRMPWHIVQASLEALDDPLPDCAHASRVIYGTAMGMGNLFRWELDGAPVQADEIDRLTDTILNGLMRAEAATPVD